MAIKIISNHTFIKLVYYYFKIYGLAPVSLKIAKVRDNTFDFSAFPSVKNIFYNLFLVSFNMVIQLYNIYEFKTISFIFDDDSERLVDVGARALSVFDILAILILYSYRGKKICKLVARINESRKYLNFLKSDKKNKKRNLSTDVAKTFLINALFWSALMLTTLKKFVIPHIALFLHFSLIFSVIIQYVFVLKLLRQMFETTNNYLKSINHYVKNVIHTEDSLSILLNISKAREFYSSLEKLSKKISIFYAKPMLVCFSHIFRNMIVIGYYTFKPIIIKKNRLPRTILVHCAIYMITMYFFIIILTQAVEDVKLEVIIFVIVIHSMLVNYFYLAVLLIIEPKN